MCSLICAITICCTVRFSSKCGGHTDDIATLITCLVIATIPLEKRRCGDTVTIRGINGPMIPV